MSVNPSSPNPKKTDEKESIKDKITHSLSGEKIEGLCSYAKSNTLDTVSYILLIVGIILLFFQSLYGGALIGIVVGLYFSCEITSALRGANDFIERQGMVRSLIIGGILLAFFILAPAIFIAAAITVGLKQLICPDKHEGKTDKK